MPKKSRDCDPKNQENLLKVVELLVSLAGNEGKEDGYTESPITEWLESQGFKDEQVRNEIIKQLKTSLPITIKWDSPNLYGFEEALADQGKQPFPSEEQTPKPSAKSAKNWLYFNPDREGQGKTIDQIKECLNKAKRKNHYNENSPYAGNVNSDDVSIALRLLKKLDCYRECSRTPEKSAARRFALDFSACEKHTLQGCKELIKEQIAKECRKPEATSKLTSGRREKTDQRFSKDLNDLVDKLLDKLKKDFEKRRRKDQKHIHVPLKATIRPAGWQKEAVPEAREPQPEDLIDLVSANDSQVLLIWEEGGAGKTSLACEIASWGLEGRLANGHALLPFFLDFGVFDVTSGTSLTQHIATTLDKCGLDISADQVGLLLRHKRLWLIVDHFSELTEEQRDWVLSSNSSSPNLPARSFVVVTSRLNHAYDFKQQSWSVTEIKPQRLKNQEPLDFFKKYVEESSVDIDKDVREMLLNPEHLLRLGDLLQRMVGHKPVTVLLAWLVMQSAIKHMKERRKSPEDGPVDLLPNSIPELMEAYVREICGDKTRSTGISPKNQDCKWKPDIILSSLKALALKAHCQNNAYHPNNFNTKLAKDAFASVRIDNEPLKADEQEGLLNALVNELTLIIRIDSKDTPGSKPYRISLDPLADYLAALKQQEIWMNSVNEAAHLQEVGAWLQEIEALRELGRNKEDSALEAVDHMRGFLAACRDCYTQWMRRDDHGKLTEPEKWQQHLDKFADLAKINPQKERIMEAKYLIRRHAFDLEYNNQELRAKAIAELSAYAQEIKAMPQSDDVSDAPDPRHTLPEMKVALQPLALILADPTIPAADRAAAAEALGHIGGEKAAKALIQMIESSEEREVAVRRAAAGALGLVEAKESEHWSLLEGILADTANHLHGDSFEAMDAKLPLLQGAARGLQRLAARKNIPTWGSEKGLKVPMLTLTATAGAVTTRVVEDVEVWQLPLPGDAPLEVVKIPGGTYTIGSPREELGRGNYGPMNQVKPEEVQRVEAQRQVTVPSFAMARFPLTQAQWRSLAGVDHQHQGDRALTLDPAKEKGEDGPVESVSWLDASAWCGRLQRHLQAVLGDQAPRVGLPSESLWEVACRAGTDTAFHFGDTIDATWGNYRGTFPYADGRSGLFVNRPLPVGSYGLVNPWGLADLHGTVWEWCADVWHPDPCWHPQDGSPRMVPAEGLEDERLLRGGSWFNVPLYCRSAYRNSYHPAILNGNVGFRVCCLPPGLPSWSFNP